MSQISKQAASFLHHLRGTVKQPHKLQAKRNLKPSQATRIQKSRIFRYKVKCNLRKTTQDIYHLLDYALAETLSLHNNIHRGRLLLAIAHGFGEALQEGALEERIRALEAALQ